MRVARVVTAAAMMTTGTALALRSLAAESPERQAKIEGLMRAYATGTLGIDAEATASAIVDDAIALRSRLR